MISDFWLFGNSTVNKFVLDKHVKRFLLYGLLFDTQAPLIYKLRKRL